MAVDVKAVGKGGTVGTVVGLWVDTAAEVGAGDEVGDTGSAVAVESWLVGLTAGDGVTVGSGGVEGTHPADIKVNRTSAGTANRVCCVLSRNTPTRLTLRPLQRREAERQLLHAPTLEGHRDLLVAAQDLAGDHNTASERRMIDPVSRPELRFSQLGGGGSLG